MLMSKTKVKYYYGRQNVWETSHGLWNTQYESLSTKQHLEHGTAQQGSIAIVGAEAFRRIKLASSGRSGCRGASLSVGCSLACVEERVRVRDNDAAQRGVSVSAMVRIGVQQLLASSQVFCVCRLHLA